LPSVDPFTYLFLCKCATAFPCARANAAHHDSRLPHVPDGERTAVAGIGIALNEYANPAFLRAPTLNF
jgi:hypothetical protein